MDFRSDINGLRAYAVVAVILYHFAVPGFSGGFIGVDVFFVISGLLMTSIILGGIGKGRFSVGQFYLGRARRIIPALAVLCVALLALGWFWLGPADYSMLGKHAAAAISFTSNFTFKDEEGYFDAPSTSKWLLHTWSLAVEWQFYLLYPLLLAGVMRWAKNRRTILYGVLWFIAAASLGACIALTATSDAFAFYMLPTRGWELIAGGLVYIYAPAMKISPRWRVALELGGMALIVASAMLIGPETPWPGFYALIPVLGAVLVLIAARQNSLWTANAAATAIGKWSYSIYLWHWPIVVALGYFGVRGSPVFVVAGMLLSIGLGAASYRLVEQPSRRIFAAGHWRLTAGSAFASMAAIAAAGTLISKADGVPTRVPVQVARIDAEAKNAFPKFTKGCGFNRTTLKLSPCILGDAHNVKWVLWGDSHAGAIVGAVLAATHAGIEFYNLGCATIFDAELKSKFAKNHCPEFNRLVWARIQNLPPNVGVIIINRYATAIKGPNETAHTPFGLVYTDMDHSQFKLNPFDLYQRKLVGTLCTIAASREVYVVGPIPEMGIEVPKTLVRHLMASGETQDISISLAEYRSRQDVVIEALAKAARECGVKVLDPTPYLCDSERCYGSRGGQPYYLDDDHLSETGNRLLVPMFGELK